MHKKVTQEQVWDEIAKVWKGYRHKALPEVLDFLKRKKGKILDLCCGSGRNLIKNNLKYYCVDFSQEMLDYAKEKARKLEIEAFFKKSQADVIPFKNDFFDVALFIDSLHCIESSISRKDTLNELLRVLKPGAEAMISVWDKNQETFNDKKKEIYIPWKINEKICKRYYYLYERQELIDLLKKIGFKIVRNNKKYEKKSNSHERKSIIVFVKKPIPFS